MQQQILKLPARRIAGICVWCRQPASHVEVMLVKIARAAGVTMLAEGLHVHKTCAQALRVALSQER